MLLVAECRLRWRGGRWWGFRDRGKGQEEGGVAIEMFDGKRHGESIVIIVEIPISWEAFGNGASRWRPAA